MSQILSSWLHTLLVIEEDKEPIFDVSIKEILQKKKQYCPSHLMIDITNTKIDQMDLFRKVKVNYHW